MIVVAVLLATTGIGDALSQAVTPSTGAVATGIVVAGMLARVLVRVATGRATEDRDVAQGERRQVKEEYAQYRRSVEADMRRLREELESLRNEFHAYRMAAEAERHEVRVSHNLERTSLRYEIEQLRRMVTELGGDWSDVDTLDWLETDQ